MHVALFIFVSHVRLHDVLIRVHRPSLKREAGMESFVERLGKLLMAGLLYGAYCPLWVVNMALEALEGCGDG